MYPATRRNREAEKWRRTTMMGPWPCRWSQRYAAQIGQSIWLRWAAYME